MNYRHGYHAGNFADLVKHAVLLAWVKRLRDLSEPVQYIDTHAGASHVRGGPGEPVRFGPLCQRL